MNTWWHLVVRQQRNMMPTQWNKCSWFLEFRFLTFPVSWLYTWASCLLLKGTVCWKQEGYHRHYLLLSKVNLNVMCFQWNFNIDTEQHGKIRLGAGLTPPVYFLFNFLQKKKNEHPLYCYRLVCLYGLKMMRSWSSGSFVNPSSPFSWMCSGHPCYAIFMI